MENMNITNQLRCYQSTSYSEPDIYKSLFGSNVIMSVSTEGWVRQHSI